MRAELCELAPIEAEPGAERPGRVEHIKGRAPRFRLFVAVNADPVAPLRFAPGSALRSPSALPVICDSYQPPVQ